MSSTDVPHAQKRARTVSPPVTFVHSDDIWMEDGNFILRTPKDDNLVVLYKVHKFVLAAHATFFHDLFSGPQDAFNSASEQYEGSPVMDTKDNYKDLDDFLKAIYFPSYTNRHRLLDKYGLKKSDFPGMYAGILELSRKYDAQGIREVVVSAICEQWPSQLRRWDDREASIQDTLIHPGQTLTPFYPDPAHTIHLAIKYNIPSVLPVAFYDFSRVHEFDTSETDHSRTSNVESLPPEGWRCYIRGRASLRTRLYTLDRKHSHSGACKRLQKNSTCPADVETFWTQRFRRAHESSDPLDFLKFSVGPGELLNVCDGCRRVYTQVAEGRRQRLWEELPDLFNLREYVGNDWGKLPVDGPVEN